mmetsp:Transcript_42692/g.69203  ORF Transcript_42692/g.69203 Transcript_42692/m.69203 type:complete len:125 (+) Transcript_42692:272-646(+)
MPHEKQILSRHGNKTQKKRNTKQAYKKNKKNLLLPDNIGMLGTERDNDIHVSLFFSSHLNISTHSFFDASLHTLTLKNSFKAILIFAGSTSLHATTTSTDLSKLISCIWSDLIDDCPPPLNSAL